MKRISFTTEIELLRELNAIASQQGRDRNLVINEALDLYIAKAKLAHLRTALLEGESSGIAQDGVFDRVLTTLHK
jgi:metal-responsive CopG/Arc/MetJ family transcriptional regulator